MTLATYQGVTWRVAARWRWPIPFLELETPAGGRCAVPASQVEILPERPRGYTIDDVLAMRSRFTGYVDLITELEVPYADSTWTGPSLKKGDRVGYQALDGEMFFGTVASHVETAPGTWSITLEEGQS